MHASRRPRDRGSASRSAKHRPTARELPAGPEGVMATSVAAQTLSVNDEQTFTRARRERNSLSPDITGCPLRQQGATLREQLPQDGSMTASLVGAITSDREVGVPGERREQIENAAALRLLHLAPVSPAEGEPLPFTRGGLPELHEVIAWRKVRKPDVVEVAAGELGLRHPARRSSHRSDAQALVPSTRAAELDDTDRHKHLVFATAGLLCTRPVGLQRLRLQPTCAATDSDRRWRTRRAGLPEGTMWESSALRRLHPNAPRRPPSR